MFRASFRVDRVDYSCYHAAQSNPIRKELCMLPIPVRAFALALVFCSLASCSSAEPVFVEVPMSDGVKLATDVYLPRGEGPFPVVVMRSTYGRNKDWGKHYLEHGYAVVQQDVRGMGASEGEKYVFHADGWREGLQDGRDCMAWVAAQPWCNGKIGTEGGSALGITQLLAAPASDLIDAQSITVGPGRFYGDVAFIGGVWRKNMLEGWLTAIGQGHLVEVYKGQPLDGGFWSYYDFVETAERVTSPGLFVGGWHDIFGQGTLDAFLARELSGGEGARGENYLIMRWSPHGPDVTTDYKFNENRFDLQVSEVMRKFFAHYLKGEADALKDVPKVHYYVFGADTAGAPGNEWRTASMWPPFETREVAYYLSEGGALGEVPSGEGARASFVFDPADPYPTHGGANLLPNLPSGPFDQRKYSTTRTDLLKFATAPLEAPVEIAGKVRVRLSVSSDAPDTDFTAKLIDIYPDGDGREINVLDSIRRVKTREGYEAFAPLLEGPEQVVELEIDLWSIAWVFNAGHRIGLHVSSSNYPKFEVNPGTGDNYPGEGVDMRKQTNTVHLGAAHSSVLYLPVR
jgi:predicted acyl esterase